MTVLVTGGAGYIGSHVVHELVDAGEPPIVLDNLSTGDPHSIPASVLLYVGDAGNRDLVSAVLGAHRINAILHFAGSIVVPDSVRDPLGYYLNNTVTTRNLIDAAIGAGVRNFIFSSTAAVYGNPDKVPVSEDAPTIPMSPYGASKLMSEVMLRDVAAASDLRHVILRYFNVAGADPALRTGLSSKNATHLLKVAVEAAVGRRPQLDVYGTDYPTPDGTCIRDFIHVTDLARAHLAALNYLRRGGASATLNCGYGHGFSVLQVVEAVKRVSGHSFAVRHTDRRPGDVMEVIADATRIRSKLGWQPQLDDLNAIVAHALAWERQLASTDRSRQALSA